MRDGNDARSEAEGQTFPRHTERLDRVWLREGVEIRSATTEDFRRSPVVVHSIIEARVADPEPGWVLYEVAKPEVMTEGEILARRRAIEGPAVDRSKL